MYGVAVLVGLRPESQFNLRLFLDSTLRSFIHDLLWRVDWDQVPGEMRAVPTEGKEESRRKGGFVWFWLPPRDSNPD